MDWDKKEDDWDRFRQKVSHSRKIFTMKENVNHNNVSVHMIRQMLNADGLGGLLIENNPSYEQREQRKVNRILWDDEQMDEKMTATLIHKWVLALAQSHMASITHASLRRRRIIGGVLYGKNAQQNCNFIVNPHIFKCIM